MRVLRFLPLMLVSLALVGFTPPVTAADAASPGSSLLRAAQFVANVERSREFYELLGFVVEAEMANERALDSPFPVNSRSQRYRLLILRSASGAGGKLGLIEFTNEDMKPVREIERTKVGRGDTVLVVDVPDVDAMFASLVAAGHRASIVEPQPHTYTSQQKSADGRVLQGKVLHVFDPDGFLVELLEAPKPVGPPPTAK